MSTDEKVLDSKEPDFSWGAISFAEDASNSSGVNLYSAISQEKSAPDSLSEYINHSSVPAGATIFVLNDNSRNDIKFMTNKFFLTSFNMSFREKAQLTETFGTANVSFFNDTVKIYNFSGRAVDYPSTGTNPGKTMNQSSLTQLYNKHLRGTQLVKEDAVGLIKVFNHMIYGYPLNFNVTYTSQQDKLASFSFQFVVTKHSQNLPGLFNEKDLEKNYQPGAVYDERDSYRLGVLRQYYDVYDTHLKIQTGDTEISYSLAKENFFYITSLKNMSFEGSQNFIRLYNFESEQELRDFQSQIRAGINSFLSYIFTANEGFLGISDSFFGESNSELFTELANGAIDNMFRKESSYNKVREFLRAIDAFKTRIGVVEKTIESKNINQ